MNDHTRCAVGVDISKAHLDVCRLPDGEAKRFANDDGGVEEFAAWVGPSADVVVYESTGHFHRDLEVLSVPYTMIALRMPSRSWATVKYNALRHGIEHDAVRRDLHATGTLDLRRQRLGPRRPRRPRTGQATLLAGVFFKLSLVPFHMWTLDVYSGAFAPVWPASWPRSPRVRCSRCCCGMRWTPGCGAGVVALMVLSSAPKPDGVRPLPGRAGRGRTWR